MGARAADASLFSTDRSSHVSRQSTRLGLGAQALRTASRRYLLIYPDPEVPNDAPVVSVR